MKAGVKVIHRNVHVFYFPALPPLIQTPIYKDSEHFPTPCLFPPPVCLVLKSNLPLFRGFHGYIL